MSGTWTCDRCGEPIKAAEDGWVEWLSRSTPEGRRGEGLRLVHAAPVSPLGPGKCQYDRLSAAEEGVVSDLGLPEFLGPDGLMRLLSRMADGSLPQDEVIEMIQRLFVRGYEQARPYFTEAITEGIIEPRMPNGFYFEDQIALILDYAKRHAD